MQSLKTKSYVTETFSWRHYYWFLTEEGASFLKSYFRLSSATATETDEKT